MDTLASVSVLGGVYNTGSSCLHLAAQAGHTAMVQRLLAAGADPRLADYRRALPPLAATHASILPAAA